MKTLRILLALTFLAVTLGYTLIAAMPVLAGPPIPEIACDGYVCYEMKPSCYVRHPLFPDWACTNLCWIGGYPVCKGQSACTICP